MEENKQRNIKEQIIVRTAVIYLFLLVFGAYLFVKLFQIMFFEKQKWQSKVEQIAVDLRKTQPLRGNIYDENGKILATSVRYYDLYMDTDAGGLTDKIFLSNVDSLAWYLSDFFKNASQSEYKQKLMKARKNRSRYLNIAQKLTYDEYFLVKQFPIFRLNSNEGGLIVEKSTLRKRPFGELMRRTIGFLGEDSETGLVQGKAGLEYSYNRELGGRAGKAYMKKIGGNNWRMIKGGQILEVENGMDLITSVNIDLQDYVDAALRDQLIELQAEYGSVVVMEVETGYIKAIANLKRNEDNTFTEVLNYAVGENVAPGSTFKLPVLMAVLEDGEVDLDDMVDTGTGHIMYHGVSVDDVSEYGYGNITVAEVFAKSSNVGMLKIIDEHYVKKHNIEKFLKQLNAIGIGDISGVDIFGENKPLIKSPEDHSWAPSTPGMIAHGYEVKISPLQLLTFYNAVANDGVMMKPKIVKRLEKNGVIVKEFEPEISNPLICSKPTLKKAQKILRDVVEFGTAKNIDSKRYHISGKTGTTEYYDSEKKMHTEQYRASFIGYFPTENPKYSVMVFIHKPLSNYYGALAAAPLFRKIADKLFASDRDINNTKLAPPEEFGIPVTKNGCKDDLNKVLASVHIPVKNNGINTMWVNTEAQKDMVVFKQINPSNSEIPNFEFMGARDAVYMAESLGLNPIIKGKGFVFHQSLVPGQNFKKGLSIILELK
jgi:cell division protein FtsI (penicillin-binding protein 3)